MYRKLAEAQDEEQVNDWIKEIEDRFGKLPDEGRNLVKAAQIKLMASGLYLDKITIRANRMWITCPSSKKRLQCHFL